ncbi:MAG: hypothetical protein P4L64_06460 [Caulobacteraceae bacterium]|nr:hypothetical protein [Caulobacteraceae bacterium]
MSKLQRPLPRPVGGLNDPRSTTTRSAPRLPDILGLRGTKAG